MVNKYVYLFIRDRAFRSVCILSLIGAIFCFALIRLNVRQDLELQDNQAKKLLIDRIPAWEARLVRKKAIIIDHLMLNGVVSNEARPMAVINNTLVKIGSEIGGKKVVVITKKSATLCDAGNAEKCITLLLEK